MCDARACTSESKLQSCHLTSHINYGTPHIMTIMEMIIIAWLQRIAVILPVCCGVLSEGRTLKSSATLSRLSPLRPLKSRLKLKRDGSRHGSWLAYMHTHPSATRAAGGRALDPKGVGHWAEPQGVINTHLHASAMRPADWYGHQGIVNMRWHNCPEEGLFDTIRHESVSNWTEP